MANVSVAQLGSRWCASPNGVFDLQVFPVCASTQTALTAGRALVEVACMTPRSRGCVDIVSTDPQAHPRIDHGYLTDPEGHDLAVLREGLAIGAWVLVTRMRRRQRTSVTRTSREPDQMQHSST